MRAGNSQFPDCRVGAFELFSERPVKASTEHSPNGRSRNGNAEPANRRGTIRKMSETTAPQRTGRPVGDPRAEPDRPWLVIVWNDPINLMSYVTWVLQKLFGYSRPKATQLMLDVHHKGRAVVSSGQREKAELDCYRLHAHGLWATVAKSD